MEIEITLWQIIVGALVLVIGNIAVWAFLWGKTLGRINQRLCDGDEHMKRHDKEIEELELQTKRSEKKLLDTISRTHITMIPECQSAFSAIQNAQSNIEGQLSIIVKALVPNHKEGAA